MSVLGVYHLSVIMAESTSTVTVDNDNDTETMLDSYSNFCSSPFDEDCYKFETDDTLKTIFMGVFYIMIGIAIFIVIIWGMTQLINQDPNRLWWILLFILPFDIALIYIGLIMIGIRCIVFNESNGYIYSYKSRFCGCFHDLSKIGSIKDFKGIILRGMGQIDDNSGEQYHIDNCYNHYALVFRFDNDETDEIIIGYKNSSYLTAIRLAVAIDDYWQQCLSRNKRKKYLIKNDVIKKSPQINNPSKKYNDVEMEMVEFNSDKPRDRFIVTEEEHEEMLELMRRYSISVGLQDF